MTDASGITDPATCLGCRHYWSSKDLCCLQDTVLRRSQERVITIRVAADGSRTSECSKREASPAPACGPHCPTCG